MPHADSALLPANVRSKSELWQYLYIQLKFLLEGQHSWVSNLSNAASLIYNTLRAHPDFGSNDRAVNWCGFYIDSKFFPSPRISIPNDPAVSLREPPPARLLLGPFCGKPACQFIYTAPDKARGVCADAYNAKRPLLVRDVGAYPGHIACDNESKSELVCPLLLETLTGAIIVGVLDLDCLAIAGFDDDDKLGLQKIAELVCNACHW